MSYCFILSSVSPLEYSLFGNSTTNFGYKYTSIVFRRFYRLLGEQNFNNFVKMRRNLFHPRILTFQTISRLTAS